MTSVSIEKIMKHCTLCPRKCGADRTLRLGACGAGAQMIVARAALHFWEEPVISGSRGSGAVFFSGCNLGCVFCQNAAISHISGKSEYPAADYLSEETEKYTHKYTEGKEPGPEKAKEKAVETGELPGRAVSVEKLAEIMLRLQDVQGANNINLVTAAHFAPQVAAALEKARDRGLTIPLVYNSSAYESVEALRLFDGLVDVYLPDFKYATPEIARKLSKAEDYPAIATAALDEMVRQAGEAEFAEEEPFAAGCSPSAKAVYEPGGRLIRRGVIVRNLLLPGHVHESEAVLRFLHERYGDTIYISIMNQYTPMPDMKKLYAMRANDQKTGEEAAAPDRIVTVLGRKVTKREYEELVDYAINCGIENGFVQEGGTAKSSFIPEWNGEGVD